MSRTELYVVESSGDVILWKEFPNAWHGAMLVWTNLTERYLVEGGAPAYHLLLRNNGQPVWDLARRPDIPESHRIVLRSTFDGVVVRREDIPRLVRAIREYAQEFNPGTLLEQAEALENLPTEAIAVCWNQTSVNADVWSSELTNPDGEQITVPYNIFRDEGHGFLFGE